MLSEIPETIQLNTEAVIDVAYALTQAIELLDGMNNRGMLNLNRQSTLTEITAAGLKFHKVMQKAMGDDDTHQDEIDDAANNHGQKSPTTLASERSSDIQA